MYVVYENVYFIYYIILIGNNKEIFLWNIIFWPKNELTWNIAAWTNITNKVIELEQQSGIMKMILDEEYHCILHYRDTSQLYYD